MSDHTDFLHLYGEPGEHYSLSDHPFGFEGRIPTKEVLDAASQHPLARIRQKVASHPSASQEHLDKLMNDPDYSVVSAIARRPDLTKSRIDALVNFPVNSSVISHTLINHQMNKLQPEHIEKYVDHWDSTIRKMIASHPDLTHDQVDRLSQDQNAYVRASVAVRPKLPKSVIDRLSNDQSTTVRMAILGTH